MEATGGGDSSGKHFRLFDLPQELQDTIFEYAYEKPEHAGLVIRGSRAHKLVTKKLQLSREEAKAKIAHYKVAEWLVCKKWFVAAAKAYVHDSPISLHVARDSAEIGTSSTLNAFAKHLITDGLDLCTLSGPFSRPRQILTLRLQVGPEHFDLSDVMDEGLDDIDLDYMSGMKLVLSNEQLTQLSVYTETAKLRGVRQFFVTMADEQYLNDHFDPYPQRLNNFRANVQRLEELLKPIVTSPASPEKPRERTLYDDVTGGEDSVARLYPQSKVCANVSTLADQAMDEFILNAMKSHTPRALDLAKFDLDSLPAKHTRTKGTTEDATVQKWSTPADQERAEHMVEEAREEVNNLWLEYTKELQQQHDKQWMLMVWILLAVIGAHLAWVSCEGVAE